jgi:hypothetical protein
VLAMRYRVNIPAVTSQVIAGEAILIHFDSGRYYTVEGSGAHIIAWLEEGRSLDDIVSAWATAGGESDTIRTAIDVFVRSLVDEGLLVARTDEPEAQAPGKTPRTAASAAFAQPSLVTYTDLEELLRLDPIHDVDEAGWPSPKVR